MIAKVGYLNDASLPAYKFPNLETQTSLREEKVAAHIGDSYIIERITMVIRNGEEISLSDVLLKLEINEDIFNPNISGFVEINDYTGGLEKFQLTGGEQIKVRILKPNSSSIVVDRQDLIVHTISKGTYNDQNNIVYRLEFTTTSAIRSQKIRVYKSYSDTRNIAEVVKDLCLQMGEDINIEKNLPITLDKAFVSPGYSPIQAINFLAKRSCASGDYYLFFDRVSTGKVFAGINNLRSLSPPIDEMYHIFYSPSLTYVEGKRTETEMRTDVVQLQNNFNHILNMNNGLYYSKLTKVDTLKRTYEVKNFDYKESMNDFYINTLTIDQTEFGMEDENQMPGERMFVPAMNDPVNDKISWVKNDLHGALLMSGMRVAVSVSGAVNQLGAGDIVYLTIPSDVHKSSNLGNSETFENNMYSGKYFVTACKHVITNQTYTKKLELSRGSVRESLANSTPFSQLSTDTPQMGAKDSYKENVSKYINSELRSSTEVEPTMEERIAIAELQAAKAKAETSRTGTWTQVDSNGKTVNYFLDDRISENIRKELISSGRFGSVVDSPASEE